MNKYRIGSKCSTGQVVAGILGQSRTACVYTTQDNHLRWEYFSNGGKLPRKLTPAVTRFNALMAKVDQLPQPQGKQHLYHLLGKSLFAALDDAADGGVPSYFREVDRLIDEAKTATGRKKRVPGSRKVFVVHGRDQGPKDAAARVLAQLGMQPIVLHEQPNAGRTIMEKLEKHADVDFAVVLLTPDDVGRLNTSASKMSPRARQNVIFELGFFCGILGRDRVVALHKGSLELPSDYDGVIYVELDTAKGWHMALARELANAGINVDLNRLSSAEE